MLCRRYAVTNTEWLTGHSGSDQGSKLSGLAGWKRATTTKKCFLLESYEKLYLYLSLIFTTLSPFYSQHFWSGWWLSAGNITSVKSCSDEKLKLAAGSFLRPICDQTASGNWIWWLEISQDLTEEANAVFIWEFLSAHKVLGLCVYELEALTFWLMQFATGPTGRNQFLFLLRYHWEGRLGGFVSRQLTQNEWKRNVSFSMLKLHFHTWFHTWYFSSPAALRKSKTLIFCVRKKNSSLYFLSFYFMNQVYILVIKLNIQNLIWNF